MSQPVLGVTGWKNSGKTTLVERLVAELVRRGRRISTVKHAHHDFDIDVTGTDSFRHRQAGAGTGSATLAVSAGRVHPVFGLWPLAGRRYLEEFLASSEKWRMIDFAGRTGWREGDFPVSGDSDPFFNINTPDDLAAAQRRMEHG